MPDQEARDTVRGLTENNIECITLSRDGPWSGLPVYMVVRDKKVNGAFVKGLRAAVKRDDNIYWTRRNNPQGLVSGGMIPCDTLVIYPNHRSGAHLGPSERTLPFTADVMEGESYILERGTVSPEFQDALRKAGVPLPGAMQGIQKFVYDTWLENVGV